MPQGYGHGVKKIMVKLINQSVIQNNIYPFTQSNLTNRIPGGQMHPPLLLYTTVTAITRLRGLIAKHVLLLQGQQLRSPASAVVVIAASLQRVRVSRPHKESKKGTSVTCNVYKEIPFRRPCHHHLLPKRLNILKNTAKSRIKY